MVVLTLCWSLVWDNIFSWIESRWNGPEEEVPLALWLETQHTINTLYGVGFTNVCDQPCIRAVPIPIPSWPFPSTTMIYYDNYYGRVRGGNCYYDDEGRYHDDYDDQGSKYLPVRIDYLTISKINSNILK